MTTLLVSLAALLVVLAWATYVGRAVLGSIDHNRWALQKLTTPEHPADTTDLETSLRAELAILTLAVSEGIARVDRHEKRIQKTVTSARRLLAEGGLEHPGLEAEAAEIQSDHERPRAAEELPAVHEGLVLDGPSGIPGISRAELAAMRRA